jgi:arginine decarboxylase
MLNLNSQNEAIDDSKWDVESSSQLYVINNWGNGYFRVNEAGNVCVTPTGDANGPKVDLHELTQDLIERGIRAPIMIRFTDILKSRVQLFNNCFKKIKAENSF